MYICRKRFRVGSKREYWMYMRVIRKVIKSLIFKKYLVLMILVCLGWELIILGDFNERLILRIIRNYGRIRIN